MSAIKHQRLLVITFFLSLSLVLWLGWQSDLAEPARVLTVAGVSMQPTLNPGDKVRLVAAAKQPFKPGDLVAVKFKTRERMMVKRVIATAGDEVRWRNEQVFVNGERLLIDGWPEDRRIPQRAWKLLGIQLKHYNNRVPPNNLIVMGDNSRNSFDSGDFGMLSTSQIAGHIRY